MKGCRGRKGGGRLGRGCTGAAKPEKGSTWMLLTGRMMWRRSGRSAGLLEERMRVRGARGRGWRGMQGAVKGVREGSRGHVGGGPGSRGGVWGEGGLRFIRGVRRASRVGSGDVGLGTSSHFIVQLPNPTQRTHRPPRLSQLRLNPEPLTLAAPPLGPLPPPTHR